MKNYYQGRKEADWQRKKIPYSYKCWRTLGISDKSQLGDDLN